MTNTPNLNLILPNFNISPWHDDVNTNFRILDAVIASTIGANNVKGKFQNSTAVLIGQKYYDEVTGVIYIVSINHTTSPIPATFAQDRITNPTYWEPFTFFSLGTMSEQNASSVAIIGGSITGIDTLTGPAVDRLRDTDLIINGNFAVWQRGTSSMGNGYVAADRWGNFHSGGIVTQSQQFHPLGTTFGVNNPGLFLRQSVSGQSGSNFATTQQRIENVRTYSNQTITVLGWAKRASGTGNLGVRMVQTFGTGGSPSANVELTQQIVTLTGSWAPFAVTFVMPSVSGKTLGTDGNDFLNLSFDTSTGTSPLGIQTIGVDLWGIHIRVGIFTTADVAAYVAPSVEDTLRQCQRYYEVSSVHIVAYAPVAGVLAGYGTNFAVTKRAPPTIAAIGGPSETVNVATATASPPTTYGFRFYTQATSAGGVVYSALYSANAEL